MEALKLKEAANKDGNPRVQKGTYKEVIEMGYILQWSGVMLQYKYQIKFFNVR
jgi:hypothetical protein